MPDGFKPGDTVLTTGIYTARHYQHRLPHDVFAVEGDRFPACRGCGARIRFELVQAATQIAADHDFSKAASGSKTKKARAGPRKA
jgi:hypothetical protein